LWINRLKLNAEKTELIWLGTRQQLAKLTVTQLQLSTSVVEFDSMVTDLGVVLDNQLVMGHQVTVISRSCFYQLRQLRVVQRSLTKYALRSLVRAFIYYRLDYCNALLAGIADTQVKRLQLVQNAAARLVSGARCTDHNHTSPVLRPLASGAASDHFQDRSACTEMYPWRRTCLSTGSMYTSEECPRSSSSTVYIDWRCGECWRQPVSGASASTVPQCGTDCRLLCATAVSHWTRSRGSRKLIFSVSNCTPSGAVVASCDFGAVYKCHDLLTYLVTTSSARRNITVNDNTRNNRNIYVKLVTFRSRLLLFSNWNFSARSRCSCSHGE